MAKTTTSKKTNTGVAKKSTTAAKKAAVEQTETVKEVETGAAAENEVVQETEPAAAVEQTETKEETIKDTTNGTIESTYPFTINSDGTVNVWSERRANKSVYGTTGDIVKFDADGLARVKLEDALHFAKVPGFTFKK